MKKKPIYIFGHKNPDTDSVCAAISLSYLKNTLGYNTISCVLGKINLETKYVLDYFGFKVPYHLNDVRLQIKDVAYHKNSYININATVKDAFDYMNKYTITGLPVVEKKNKYYGYISLKEIAFEVINSNVSNVYTSYGNLLKLIKGIRVLQFDKEINGNVIYINTNKDFYLEKNNINNSSVLIIDDYALIEPAIRRNVKLIINNSKEELSSEILNLAIDNKVNIIKTSFSTYEVGKLVTLSNYIKIFVKSKEKSITFNEFDYLSDAVEKMNQTKHNNYPVLNSKNECSGVLTLTDASQVDRKKVILVDHNNFRQSVDGLEEADILEVIDHHNIGDIVTKRPINFRNTSCGCVSTIIYEMFNENNIRVPKEIAGLLLSAIISDTLLLTSPTTTQKDIIALKELAQIAKVDYKKYGMDMLKHGMSYDGLKSEDLLYKDFKSYRVNDHLLGIGQILTFDYNSLKNKINNITEFLNEESIHEKYKVLTLFVTDIFANKSYCYYNEDSSDIIKNSFNLDNVCQGVMLPGVLSRKIQIAPFLMDTIGK